MEEDAEDKQSASASNYSQRGAKEMARGLKWKSKCKLIEKESDKKKS